MIFKLYYDELSSTFLLTQTTESKKEEFRKYLEKTGVIDHLTRALVGLYEEGDKPNNSIDYLKKNLGAPVELDTLKLKSELDKVKEENVKIRKELEQNRKEVHL